MKSGVAWRTHTVRVDHHGAASGSRRSLSRNSGSLGMQAVVTRAFWDYPKENLSRQCAYMYSISREILGNGGETDYALPHEGIIERGREEGIFADPLCTQELTLKAEEHIMRLSESQGICVDDSDIRNHFVNPSKLALFNRFFGREVQFLYS